MKQIPLTQGKYALIDDEDVDAVQRYKWHVSRGKDGKPYAATNICREGKCTSMKMHRFIMDATKGEEIDHRNMNTLDDRRFNLRRATKAENMRNRKATATNCSGFKGVSFHPDVSKWSAEISVDKHRVYLRLHDSPAKAALAYDCAARQLHGEFCRLNFPDVHEYPFTFEALAAKRQTSSRYEGVSFNQRASKWKAYFTRDRKRIFLHGYFATEEEAHQARVVAISGQVAERY